MAERHDKSPSRGLGRWLAAAPPTTSIGDVLRARRVYDDPSEAWPEDEREASCWGRSA